MFWYKLSGDGEISIALFVLMLIIFFIKPIAHQSPTQTEEFLQKYRRSKERQANLEQMRKNEKKRVEDERMRRQKREGDQ